MSLTEIPLNRTLERYNCLHLFIERLTGADATVTTFDQIHEAQLALSHGDLDAILTFDSSGKPSIQLEGSDPAVNKMVLLLLQRVMSANAASIQPNVTYLHGSEDMASFDSFGPVLIGFFSFFFVFMLAGVSFLRKNKRDTRTFTCNAYSPF